MSWGEVKKINSDLNVPLDERMNYFHGIVPRGIISRTASCSDPPRGNFTCMLDITGRGLILSAYTTGNQSSKGDMYVYIDEGTDEERILHFYSSGSQAGFSVNLDTVFVTGTLEDYMGDSSITLNAPLQFQKSLKVNIMSIQNSSTDVTGTVQYALLD